MYWESGAWILLTDLPLIKMWLWAGHRFHLKMWGLEYVISIPCWNTVKLLPLNLNLKSKDYKQPRPFSFRKWPWDSETSSRISWITANRLSYFKMGLVLKSALLYSNSWRSYNPGNGNNKHNILTRCSNMHDLIWNSHKRPAKSAVFSFQFIKWGNGGLRVIRWFTG